MSRRDPGFMQIGDALTGAMSNKDRPLSQNAGKAGTVFHLTEEMLHQRAARLGVTPEGMAAIDGKAAEQFNKGMPLCESPIERMVLAALINADWHTFLTIPPLVHDAKNDVSLPAGDIIIVPQMAFLRFRIDFGLVVDIEGHRRIIAIECDGADYHADAAKERARNLYLSSWDIPVFHLTGADIHRDAALCIDEINSHIEEWRRAHR